MPTVTYRVYKCRNCGHEQHISTNHHGSCIDFCLECSWKPSFGQHAVPFNGRTYRPFDYAREL
jgi:predicted nucleic acid-binding Zn ribbon protein